MAKYRYRPGTSQFQNKIYGIASVSKKWYRCITTDFEIRFQNSRNNRLRGRFGQKCLGAYQL